MCQLTSWIDLCGGIGEFIVRNRRCLNFFKLEVLGALFVDVEGCWFQAQV